jgi:2-iminoacetate synthase ThiH
MNEAEIELLIQKAAKRGAEEALREVGLHDEEAIHDIREMRELLDAWREARRAVTTTITKTITIGLLSLLAVGAYVKGWGQ